MTGGRYGALDAARPRHEKYGHIAAVQLCHLNIAATAPARAGTLTRAPFLASPALLNPISVLQRPQGAFCLSPLASWIADHRRGLFTSYECSCGGDIQPHCLHQRLTAPRRPRCELQCCHPRHSSCSCASGPQRRHPDYPPYTTREYRRSCIICLPPLFCATKIHARYALWQFACRLPAFLTLTGFVKDLSLANGAETTRLPYPSCLRQSLDPSPALPSARRRTVPTISSPLTCTPFNTISPLWHRRTPQVPATLALDPRPVRALHGRCSISFAISAIPSSPTQFEDSFMSCIALAVICKSRWAAAS